MNKSDLKYKLLTLIPSIQLKEKIIKSKFDFSDSDMVKMINDLAGSFEEKVLLLYEASLLLEEKSSEFADSILIEMKYAQEAFNTNDPTCVYELNIHYRNSHVEEKYLTVSLESARNMLDFFVKKYPMLDDDNIEIKVVKRRVLSEPEENDFVAEAKLSLHGTLLSYNDKNDTEFKECPEHKEISCGLCNSQCRFSHPLYPCMLKNGDIVTETGKNRKVKYGMILFCDNKEPLREYYVVDLEHRILKSGDLSNYFSAHTMISPAFLNRIPMSDLPSKTKDLCMRLKARLKTDDIL